MKVLRAAEQVLGIGGRFRYAHQLEDPHDRVAILEFATEVDGKQVEGVDKPPGLIIRSVGHRRDELSSVALGDVSA